MTGDTRVIHSKLLTFMLEFATLFVFILFLPPICVQWRSWVARTTLRRCRTTPSTRTCFLKRWICCTRLMETRQGCSALSGSLYIKIKKKNEKKKITIGHPLYRDNQYIPFIGMVYGSSLYCALYILYQSGSVVPKPFLAGPHFGL